MNWFKKYYPLLIIILLGLILRLFVIIKYGSFWDDEMFSFVFSQKSWTESFVYWLYETNPPLHLLFLKIWFYFLPASEFFARLPSLLFALATIPLVYLLGKNWQGKMTGYITAFYLALHPYHIFWSATARTYTLTIFLTTGAVYFFYKIFFLEEKNRKNYLGLAIFNLLSLLSHLSAGSIILTQILLLLYKKTNFKLWWQINISPLILAGSWLISSLWLKMSNLNKSWFFNLNHDLDTFLTPLSNIFLGVYPPKMTLLFIIPLLIILFIFLSKKIKEKAEKTFVILAIALLPMFISFFLNLWHIKFFLVSLPFWLLLVAGAFAEVLKNKKLIFIALGLFCSSGLIFLWSFLPLTNWQPLQKYLTTNFNPAKKQALVYNNYILDPQIEKYLKPPQENIPFVIESEKNWEDWAVKRNYLYIKYSQEQLTNWLSKNNLFANQEIFLIQGEYDYMTNLNKLLEKNNYILEQPAWRLPILGRYYLYHYVKN